MKYIIKIGISDNGRIKWCYYNGNTYKHSGEHLVDDFFTESDSAKRYLTRKAAESDADKLEAKCANVNVWLIEEVEE